MKAKWILAWGLVVLALFNFSVWKKERMLAEGRQVLLALAPVDPRSLMQGDYMVLDYAVRRNMDSKPRQSGRLVLRDDERGVAQLVGLDDGTALAADCYFLKYKAGRHRISLGAESFFFEEGQGPLFEQAAFGELVVDASGNSVLVGLRDKDLQKLEPQAKEQ